MHISRRSVLASAAAAGATALMTSRDGVAAGSTPERGLAELGGHDPVTVRWLEGGTPAEPAAGTTWGVPWRRGALAPEQEFSLVSDAGEAIPVQSWPTGWWPDGSVKWTAHAVSGADPRAETYRLAPGEAVRPAAPVTVSTDSRRITVDTGVITVAFRR